METENNKPQNKKSNGRPTFAQLKQQLADEKAKYAILENDIEETVEARVRKRISEKDAYLNRIENEYENKIANKDLIIAGLQRNLTEANKAYQELLTKQKPQKKSWLQKLFGNDGK